MKKREKRKKKGRSRKRRIKKEADRGRDVRADDVSLCGILSAEPSRV